MGMLGRKRQLALCLLLLTAQAWAEEAAPAEGSQPKTVIKLPLKLKAAAPDAHKAEPAKPAAPAAEHKTEAKPAAKAEAKPEAKHAEAKPAEAKQAESKPPEKMEPAVKMAPPPTAKNLSEPSPEVHAPVKKRRAAKPKRKAVPVEHGDAHLASEAQQVRSVVTAIVEANARYMKSHDKAYFERFAEHQSPRATVVTCSDSRVQTNAFHGDAVNDLFMVRDIGNQLATAEGSVEYGVRHLHTPLLIIIGHAACGAIKAASGDYGGLEPAIRKELATIDIPKGIDPTNGALLNVNNQVETAIMTFAGEVEGGKLAVLGAFYDFRNDLKQGYGKLVITNLNGETDPAKIREMTRAGQFFKYSFMK